MARYRSKPVTIEAALFDGLIVGEPDGLGAAIPGTCPSWFPSAVRHVGIGTTLEAGNAAFAGSDLIIGTLEGTMRASAGDYIIRGTRGEIYPCKPDVFATKYEKLG